MMLNWILSSSVLILGIIGIRFLFQKKMKCKLQYALWLLVLIRLLVPFSIGHSSMSVSNTVSTISPIVMDQSQVAEQPWDEVPMEPPVLPAGGADRNPGMEKQPASPVVEVESISFREMLPMILCGIWITGSIVTGMTFLSANLTFRRRLKVSRHRIPDYPCKLPVYVTNRIQSPCLFGMHHPAIYLTRQVMENETMVRHTVAHEFTHYRHKDHMWVILRGVCLTIHWFNPLVWWAAILSQRDAELACDEDTIKVLGEGERKAYGMTLIHVSCQKNTNLLTAATTMTADKKVLKQRIQTIARKRKNAALAVIAVTLLAAIFVGCTFSGAEKAKKAEKPLPEETTLPTEKASQDPVQGTDVTDYPVSKDISFQDQFTNMDGSVEFTWKLDQNFALSPMSAVEVTPHFLTVQDVKNVSQVLFPNAEFLEAQNLSSPVYGKKDILEKITRWEPYTSKNKVEELYGEPKEGTSELVKEFIEEYTTMYETAPEGSYEDLCEWEFKKSSYYIYSSEDADTMDLSFDDDEISAQIKHGNVSYLLRAFKHENNYQANTILLYLWDGVSPDMIDERIFTSSLCSTPEPTLSQIQSAVQSAQEMLDQMEMGEWIVDQGYVENQHDAYVIHVTAVPLVDGIPAVRQTQNSMVPSDGANMPEYKLTDVHFEFSANGDLVGFRMESPVDVIGVQNDVVNTVSIEEQLSIARDFLKLSDNSEYGFSEDMIHNYESENSEDIVCKINICNMNYTLNRVKVENKQANYYYVPGLTLYGTVDYYGKTTGKLYASSGENFGLSKIIPLVTINGVDGSIIY